MGRRRLAALVGLVCGLVVGLAPAAHGEPQVLWDQDFSTGTDGWSGDIAWNQADGTATVTGPSSTDYGGVPDSWPGDWVTELDVYLDPSWTDFSVFWYEVRPTRANGSQLRDYRLVGGRSFTGDYFIGDRTGDQAVQITPKPGDAVGMDPGWYTVQHVFQDVGGVLVVTLNVINTAGDVIYTRVRSNPDDAIGTVVGGPGTAGFRHLYASSPTIDNSVLSVVTPLAGTKDDCKDGGFADFGFDNQGRCVASIQANEHAGK